MPFTFSHSALVLPLSKIHSSWISMTALVAGSMVPDFEYFITLKNASFYAHTLAGLFWFDLPFGLLLTFLYHGLVRDPLTHNLPRFLNRRLTPFTDFDWNAHFRRYWPGVLLCILVGAASHLLLDDFTHEHGLFVKLIPVLSEKPLIAGWHIPVYDLLQYAFSLLGGLVVIWVILRLPAGPESSGQRPVFYWLIVAITFIVLVTVRLFLIRKNSFGDVIVVLISGSLAGLILASLVTKGSISGIKKSAFRNTARVPDSLSHSSSRLPPEK